MTELNEPKLLATWLDAHPGEAPPEGIDPAVVEAVYALRPDLAPAPRVTLDDILGGVTTGPFARTQAPAVPVEPAFGGGVGGGWSDDLALQLSATYDAADDSAQDDPAAPGVDAAPEVEVEAEPEVEVEAEPEAAPADPADEEPLTEGASDLDELPAPRSEDDPEVTPVVGVTGTDPLVQGVEEATDPELQAIDASIETEDTSPSGRGPSFGVVDAPPPPQLGHAEPPPSLRNPVVELRVPVGPLSSAGMPTNPPAFLVEDEPSGSEPEAAGAPPAAVLPDAAESAPAEVVDLTAHRRWGGRRAWTIAGTLAAAALVLVVVVPNQTLQDAALSPGRMAPEPLSLAKSEGEAPAADAAPEAVYKTAEHAYRPDQPLSSSTRAGGGPLGSAPPTATAVGGSLAGSPEERKNDDGWASGGEAQAPQDPTPATPEGAAVAQTGSPDPEPAKDVMERSSSDEDRASPKRSEPLARSQSPDDAEWDDVDDAAFVEVEEEAPMTYQAPAPASAPSLADESAQGDWGVATSESVSRGDRRRKSESGDALAPSEGIELDGGIGTLRESSPGAGPTPPPPHELDLLRREAKPSDYRSDWYLVNARLPDATLERIRKARQEADADTRLDDYAHAAAVVGRLVDDEDVRVAQDYAGQAAVWYLEAGDPAAAIAIIGAGKARGSANTPYLARLHYLEGQALERQGKAGWAAESYRTAQNLNNAR